jgi:hypothetical protein
MDIYIDGDLLIAYHKAGGVNTVLVDAHAQVKEQRWYRRSISTDYLEAEDLALLIKCNEGLGLTEASQRKTQRTMKSLLKLKQDHTTGIRNLEVMAEAIKRYLEPLPHHWVFTEVFGQQVPWHVEEVRFHPAETRNDYYRPAYVSVSLLAKRRGTSVTCSFDFERGDLGPHGTTPGLLLSNRGIIVEDAGLLLFYEASLERYTKLVFMTGEQLMVGGVGELGYQDEGESDRYSYWHRDTLNFEKAGGPSRAIMDDSVGYGGEGSGRRHNRNAEPGTDQAVYVDSVYWARCKSDEEREEAQDVVGPVPAPIQPFVCVFSLASHEFAVVHIDNVVLYEYNAALAEKLVLPPDHRSLIDVLIGTSTKRSEDLVRGKTGGVVILCSGMPGTGKTLTAEIYAEVAARPLYTVQCSQLGVDAESLEKELGVVLRRSIRWNAITLIDEADVYIHERGSNINQNAVVGVFLRLLEYYSGVLFLTTNRETVVDDAIMSRCIAHIHYGVPKLDEDKRKLWNILSAQYGVELKPPLVSKLIETFPDVTGRTIKQFCRLVQSLREVRKVDLELFKWLAQFQNGAGTKTKNT